MNTHPTPEQLRHWREGRLGEADSQAIENHLDMCVEVCQPLLETLTDGALSTTVPMPTDALTGPSARPAPPGYELLGELGRGGKGVVYKARQTRLNRLVALKMILAGGHAGRDDLARFRTEAEAVARLCHPNIVQIFEVGEHEGLPFLALEFLEEGSLDQKLTGAPQPAREAARFVETLARAVDHAHERGIIHRDLKPANILLRREGRGTRDQGSSSLVPRSVPLDALVPKITDFGLAKRIDQTGQTASGMIVGTPEYMAPEQAGGRVREVGPRSDVYALGVILYELLTGRSLFRANSLADTLLQVLHDEPVPPRHFVPQLPRDLETICLKCLEKGPRDRYETAAKLAHDLQLFLEDKPITARPLGPLARAWRWRRRNPLVAGLAAGLATLLVVATVGATIVALEYRAKAATEAQARVDLEEQLYTNRIAVAERELTLNQDVGLASSLLEQCPERLRGWEWDYLMRLREGGRAPLTGHKGGLWTALFNRDGRQLATASIDGTVKIWDVRSSKELRTFTGHVIPFASGIPVTCLAYSPDGRYLASASLVPSLPDLTNARKAFGVVKIWDPRTFRETVKYDKQVGLVYSLAYSPDGRRIATSHINDTKTVAVWDAQTGREIHVFQGIPCHTHRLRYSTDGRFLLAGGTDGVIRIWDAATFESVRTLDAHSGAPVYDLAFSPPDGARFASSGVDGTVRVWETATFAPVMTLRGHTGAAMGVTFSPDGRRIASAGYDKTVRLWSAATGEEKITLRGHKDMVLSVDFSPEGRQLVSASFDKEARIWDASPAEEPSGPGLFSLVGHNDRVNAVAFSSGGRRLASGGYDRTVRLWDGMTGKALHTLEGHKGPIWSVAFSPDGQRVASGSWDRTVKIWDADSGYELVTFAGHGAPVHGVAFSPDGKRMASTSWEGLVKVWDPSNGMELRTYTGHLLPTMAVAFSPDGKRIASGGGDRTVRVWEVESGHDVFTLRGHEALVHSVAFSPDGMRIASASWDGTGKVWDARTGKELLTFKGHSDRVQSLAFSPDGTRIASASEDKTVRFWDAIRGQEVLPPGHHHGVVWSVSFSPDGKRVATGCWSSSGWIKTWSADVEGDK